MRRAILLLTCGFALPIVATATTLTQTLTFDSTDFSEERSTTASFTPVFSGTVNRFDPTLGLLEQVTLNYSFTFSGTKYNGATPGGFGVSGSGVLAWDGSEIGSGSMSSGGGGAPFAELPFAFTISDSTSGPISLSLEDVLGPGVASLSFSTELSPPPDATIQLDSGTFTLTYTYAAVPEPSTYAAIFGVAALGVAWRRRATVRLRSAIGLCAASEQPEHKARD